jgi:RND family efflux transporter MFP subunit
MSALRKSILAAPAIIAALNLAACGKSEQDPRTRRQLVRAAVAERANAPERAFTGVVAARVQSNLGFRVGGKVIARFVDVGQQVRASQPLMSIDTVDYQHAITAQKGNVAAAKARYVQAAADEVRHRTLVGSGAVSKASYDQAKAAADATRAELDAAEAQLKVAKDQVEYSTLLADADGTVVETVAEPGQVVSAGQIVVKLAHAGPREAAVSLPETVRPVIGSPARAALYGKNLYSLARLRQLSDAADPQTRTFEARYVLDGDAQQSPLGATVTVYLENGDAGVATSVPLGAIFDKGDGPGVWILNADTVFFRPVRIARLSAEAATIRDGVAPGERVVAMGGHLLHEGEHIRVDGEAASVAQASNEGAAK